MKQCAAAFKTYSSVQKKERKKPKSNQITAKKKPFQAHRRSRAVWCVYRTQN